MKELIFKITAGALILLTALLTSLTCAASSDLNHNEASIFNSEAGCMACHQIKTPQADDVSEKSQAKLRRQTKTLTTPNNNRQSLSQSH